MRLNPWRIYVIFCKVSISEGGMDYQMRRPDKNGEFPIKSFYMELMRSTPFDGLQPLWRSRFLLELISFYWMECLNKILTIDNLCKRNKELHILNISISCLGDVENVAHLFF